MAETRSRGGTASPPRSDRAESKAVAGLLDTACRCLEVDLCWLSRMIGETQVIEACSGDAAAFGVRPGSTVRYSGRCHLSVPAAHSPPPAARTDLDAMATKGPVSGRFGAGSYVGVPVALADGRLYGMLCCLSRDRALTAHGHQARSLSLLADVLSGALTSRRQNLEERRQRIQDLIDSGGPRMTFQPVFDLPSLDCMGAEALARFPAGFGDTASCFAEAAAVGLETALELSAIRAALRAFPRLPPEFGLGINASPTTIVSGAIAEMIADIPADRLVLEVTEHGRIDDYPSVNRALDVLRREGVRIAVDDVGAGYAGLHHLVQLRPDFIKMDQCLTRDIDTDPVRRALAAALVIFAQEIDGLVLAEGVETAAELGVLIGAGVHQAQGVYLAPPGPLPLPASADQTHPSTARSL